MTTGLHQQRLETVQEIVRQSGGRAILDLGCGDGDLLIRLARNPRIERILGIDVCRESLDRLRQRLESLAEKGPAQIELVHGSMTEPDTALTGFDCAILLETIEHMDPERFSVLESAVFYRMRPATVVITTPNAECNPLLGVPSHRFRHPDHRFEWDRARFQRWVRGVAVRNGYEAVCSDIAGNHPLYGGASQMAVFRIASCPGNRRAA